MKQPGIVIRSLAQDSDFFREGLRKGDRILSVNREKISDELDFRFHSANSFLEIDLERRGAIRLCTITRQSGKFPGIEFVQKPVRRCANKCIFCFIDQMPKGLRSPLYVKDEDLSHSFLNGNYVTLSNAGPAALQKIAGIGLSPLFISVHATDPAVRNTMLGLRRGPAIMAQLKFLRDNYIRFHTQIVVCPGYNDGDILDKTVADLLSLGGNLLSIAVVPVGITRFRKLPLQGIDKAGAIAICDRIGKASDRDHERHKTRRVFCADELFLKAGIAIPRTSYYEDFPQIENGVGLIRKILDDWKSAKKSFSNPQAARARKYLLLTSVSAFPFLKTICREAEKVRPKVSVTVATVNNIFFGETVTVAGLLTASDILKTIRQQAPARYDKILLPGAMFNRAGATLDGYSAKRIAKQAAIPVHVINSIKDILQK
jgi:putative radical SAM enzyme (TIGR03279 family)